MTWPIDSDITKQTKSKREKLSGDCEVGLVDGVWWMTMIFDEKVTVQPGEVLQVAFKLDKP